MRTINREKIKKDLIFACLGNCLYSPYEILKDYFETTKELFNKKIKKLDQKKNNRCDVEDICLIEDDYKSYHRISTFIISYSIFDDLLKSLCSTLNRILGDNIKIYQWRGILQNSNKYLLSKKVDISKYDDEYNEIDLLRILRNSYAHTSGWLYSDDTEHNKLIEAINSQIGLMKLIVLTKHNDSYKIKLTDEFIIEAQQKMQDYLINLFKEIRISYENSN